EVMQCARCMTLPSCFLFFTLQSYVFGTCCCLMSSWFQTYFCDSLHSMKTWSPDTFAVHLTMHGQSVSANLQLYTIRPMTWSGLRQASDYKSCFHNLLIF